MSTAEFLARAAVAAAGMIVLLSVLAAVMSAVEPEPEEHEFRCAACLRVVPLEESAPDVEGVGVWCRRCADEDRALRDDDDIDPPNAALGAA